MKTAKERLYRVDYAEEKLGDTVTKEMMNTSEYEKGYGSIISTCCKAGYNLSGDGLCDKIIRNLYKIYCFYGDIGLVKVLPIMRGTEPSTLKAKGIAAYPERVELSLALYLQDYLVSLGEPKQFNEKGKKIS